MYLSTRLSWYIIYRLSNLTKNQIFKKIASCRFSIIFRYGNIIIEFHQSIILSVFYYLYQLSSLLNFCNRKHNIEFCLKKKRIIEHQELCLFFITLIIICIHTLIIILSAINLVVDAVTIKKIYYQPG